MTKRIEKKGSTKKGAEIDAIGRLNAELKSLKERHKVELDAARAETDTLARSISHDLRSPLHIIGGFADMLSKHSARDLDEKGRHYLGRINTATDQIGQMLDKILALSQMSRSEMHTVPVDMGDLVKRVVHDLDSEKQDRRVIWLIGNLPTVEADPTLLREAIMSLASNALNFTRSREVARIQFGMEGKNGESRFFIRDNGASFDISHRETMFGAVLGKRPPSDSKGGAVRLAYVRRIIQRHGGRMWTEAVPDGGATFYFSLPTEYADPETSTGTK